MHVISFSGCLAPSLVQLAVALQAQTHVVVVVVVGGVGGGAGVGAGVNPHQSLQVKFKVSFTS